MTAASGSAAAATSTSLKRTLSLWQVTASGVGIVIGAGIYVLIGTAAQEAGNAVWLSFVLAAILSALTGLSYAELAGMFPSAGAEYEFARRAFNEFVGFLMGWMMVAALLIAAGTVSIGFAQYAEHFANFDRRLVAIGLLAAVTLVIGSGIERSIWLTIALVLAQIGGLLLVIASGVPHIGDRALLEGSSAAGVLSGAALVFFAFIGFDEVVTLSEETRDPRRAIPIALMAALGIATILYVLVGIASVSIVGAGPLAASDRPLALVMEHDWGTRGSDIVAAIAIAATTNTTLLAMTAASRNVYGMARSGSLPRSLATLGAGTRAPYIAALVGLTVAAPVAVVGDIGLAAGVTDVAVFVIFAVVDVAVIALRFRMPDAPRTFTVPLSLGRVPLIPILALIAVVVMGASVEPSAWIGGGGLVVAGVAVWLLLRTRRVVAPLS